VLPNISGTPEAGEGAGAEAEEGEASEEKPNEKEVEGADGAGAGAGAGEAKDEDRLEPPDEAWTSPNIELELEIEGADKPPVVVPNMKSDTGTALGSSAMPPPTIELPFTPPDSAGPGLSQARHVQRPQLFRERHPLHLHVVVSSSAEVRPP